MNAMELTGKDLIAYRTARLFKDGDVVNLGIGMPTKCLDYLPEGVDVWVDSENGVVGLTGAPKEGEYADPNVVDAGGKPLFCALAAPASTASVPSALFAVATLMLPFWVHTRLTLRVTWPTG